MNQNVLIVGSVALDNIKTPGGEMKNLLGGSAVYGSVAASIFTNVDIVGVAGEDFPPGTRRDPAPTGRGPARAGMRRRAQDLPLERRV